MRLSISAKIFVGFLVVAAVFGGVAVYGGVTLRRLGDELRLVSRGYLDLEHGTSEMQTGQARLLKLIEDQLRTPEGEWRVPAIDKSAIDFERRSRLKTQIPYALGDIARLEALRSSAEEHALLHQLRTRLSRVEQKVRADEELFDQVYGPVGDRPVAQRAPDAAKARAAANALLDRERQVEHELDLLWKDLKLRAQQSGLRLEEEENRAVWVLLVIAVVALVVCLVVMVIATLTLRPLRRLAERAKEIARGDYKQRVEAGAHDEVGQLAREFNAMAAALDEREQQLIRSERLAAVGKIAAQITHEVRNPLSSIGLNAELLEEELAQVGGDQAKELRAIARSIVKEVDRLTEITEEYLRFARLPRPKLVREDLRAIVQSLASFMRGELSARGIELEVALDPLLQIAADEHQLRQALLNLMRNGAEAMERGGRLAIRAHRVGAFVELEVSDTGDGIAPEHLAKIFDPFFSTKDGGTGLGLALTQQIIVEHGGAIDVRSRAGAGTTFTVRLPALAEDDDGKSDAPPASPNADELAASRSSGVKAS